jgi:tRNA pseudouridine32 synthase/23S rRNA pseudouridine746 synthase/23S rRNA pseudouridine1911/1915/1917 synthase
MDSLAVGTWNDLRERYCVFEDDDLLALNKPPGLSVVGDNVADDILSLAQAAGEGLHPVHRIDKVTSGLILFARTAPAHAHLARLLNRHEVDKTYLAVVEGVGLPERGTIELPLSTGRKNRVRVAAQRDAIVHDRDTGRWRVEEASVASSGRIYPSTTRFHRLAEADGRTLLTVQPVTGRKHQIRVHLAWIGYPVVGDPLFAPKGAPSRRTLLHSWRLAFAAADGRRVDIEAPADAEFRAAAPVPDEDLSAILAGANDVGR